MNNEMDNNPASNDGQQETSASQVEESTVSTVSPGSILAQRREELNLTVEQVAGQLNLAPRQVEAIEADNFGALPGIAIARGFVRSYARLVKVDAEPLLAAMAPAVAPMSAAPSVNQTYMSKPMAADRLTFGQRNVASSKSVWILVGLVAAGVAVAAAMQFGVGAIWSGAEDNESVESSATTQEAPQEQGRAVEMLPTPEMPVESEPNPAAPTENPGTPAAPAPQSAAPSAPPTAAAAAAAPAKADTPTNAAVTDEKNALVLRMREQSWVEIKRGDGAVIAARIFDAGTVEAIPLRGELVLVVGNASGVEASLRGEPLDLQTKAKANVARVSVK